MSELRRGRLLFATPATEPRARRFTDVTLCMLAALGLWVAIASDVPPPGFVVAFAVLVRSAPEFLETAWQISADVLALFAIVLGVAAAVRHRFDVVRNTVVAIAAAALVWLIADRHPSLRVSRATAVIVTMAPHLTRPVRRVGRSPCSGRRAAGALAGRRRGPRAVTGGSPTEGPVRTQRRA